MPEINRPCLCFVLLDVARGSGFALLSFLLESIDALVVLAEALNVGKKVVAHLESPALMRCGQANELAGNDPVVPA